ncbi:cytochrome b [Loktanella sp. S4079]|uniref:cytochrome b n=1 Tax=Loktanella sp. S4079 TaxID=579483 RepID=UPI0005F9E40D|nr:cytochrome b/b6 domain-containing protein [Loktanella sp. S4079]KJZ18155.1 hypothetical protein TW80_15685 [Loktanella sp. S4079]
MKYRPSQIIYHWITVLLIIALVLSGLAFSNEWTGAWVIKLHQIAGQLLAILLACRIIARLRFRRVHRSAHALWERIAAQATHGSLYLCMIGLVITGYVAASGLRSPFLIWPASQAFARSDTGETLLYWHFDLKWVLLALIALHILGVLKHLLWDKDNTLSHMSLRYRKE